MVVQYAPGGFINEHDHAFEEGFFFLEGEIEAELEGETHVLAGGRLLLEQRRQHARAAQPLGRIRALARDAGAAAAVALPGAVRRRLGAVPRAETRA